MNREIKFRAWDKKRKCMIGTDYPNNWDRDCDEWWGDTNQMTLEAIEALNKEDENIKLMQFTGIENLYEGDIVKCVTAWGFGISDMIGQITYSKGAFNVKGEVLSNTDGRERQFSINTLWHFELLGNIYENPELLK